jgi:hypothetical protein
MTNQNPTFTLIHSKDDRVTAVLIDGKKTVPIDQIGSLPDSLRLAILAAMHDIQYQNTRP